MAATFLPSILVPLVGLIFPAFSMALFFLYTQESIRTYMFFGILQEQNLPALVRLTSVRNRA